MCSAVTDLRRPVGLFHRRMQYPDEPNSAPKVREKVYRFSFAGRETQGDAAVIELMLEARARARLRVKQTMWSVSESVILTGIGEPEW